MKMLGAVILPGKNGRYVLADGCPLAHLMEVLRAPALLCASGVGETPEVSPRMCLCRYLDVVALERTSDDTVRVACKYEEGHEG